LALADAFQTTGLDKWIANSLSFVKELNYVFIIVIIVAITIFATEIMSNTAAAAVFIPVAASLATTIPLDIVGILIVTIMSTLLVPIVFAP